MEGTRLSGSPAEWRSASTNSGGPSATMAGVPPRPSSRADNWVDMIVSI